jgi:hypothetical protein
MVKKEKAKETITPAWHPDYRDVASLPDVKVVRTDFLVNFVAITLCLVLAVIFAYRQLKAWDYDARIAEFETQIASSSSSNNQNLRLSGEFKKSADKIEDVNRFLNLTPSTLSFLLQLAETRPEHIAFSSVEFVENVRQVSKDKRERFGVFTVSGMLKGSSAEALDAIEQYRGIVAGLPILADKVSSISVPPPRRNPTLDLFEFDMVITLKPSA